MSFDQCEHKGPTKYSLKKHKMFKHQDVFKCDQCNIHLSSKHKTFLNISNFHLGSKIECELWYYYVRARSTRKAHIEAVHKCIQYTCNTCNKGPIQFWKYTYNTHITLNWNNPLFCEFVSLARSDILCYNHHIQMFSFVCYDGQFVCVFLYYLSILQSYCT